MNTLTKTRTLATEEGVLAWDAELEEQAGGDQRLLTQLKEERLRSEVQKGFASIEEGRCTVIRNDKELHDYFDDLSRRAHERVLRRREEERRARNEGV